jgi:hypothetical protein
MRPSRIRSRVLADHQTLRDTLMRLEQLTREVSEGDVQLVGTLRVEGEIFLARLLEHARWEEQHLRPALGGAESADETCAQQLDRVHREQRELVQYAVAVLHDQDRPPLLIARNLRDLVRLIHADMDEEEESLRRARALGDDWDDAEVERC